MPSRSPLCSDPSFFGAEWQKRWCVLNDAIFYYYGTDKGFVLDVGSADCRFMFVGYVGANSLCLPSSADKQQKGSLYISDYDVQLVNNLRKDSKKNSCFELFAPGRRSFQVSV